MFLDKDRKLFHPDCAFEISPDRSLILLGRQADKEDYAAEEVRGLTPCCSTKSG